MLALFGTILGLLGSLAPEILKFFNNKEDHKHEREVLSLQMEASKLQHVGKMQEIEANADIQETLSIQSSAKQVITGSRILDGIVSLYNGSVRPTITYGFFVLYAAVKWGVYVSYTQAGYDWTQAIQTIWGQEDFAVFSTVISFWFGSRFLKYSLQRAGQK